MIVLCYFFSVFWSKILYSHFYVPPIRAVMPDSCMNTDVELTVFKIVFYEILIMHVIKFITKTYVSQGSDTNLEMNICPLPK